MIEPSIVHRPFPVIGQGEGPSEAELGGAQGPRRQGRCVRGGPYYLWGKVREGHRCTHGRRPL